MWQLVLLKQNLAELIFVDLIAGSESGYCGETITLGNSTIPVMTPDRVEDFFRLVVIYFLINHLNPDRHSLEFYFIFELYFVPDLP